MPAVILVPYAGAHEVVDALRPLGGQLAISIHSEPADTEWVQTVLPQCVAQAGRIVFDGFSTGVSVCWAMMHGGPYPASSNAAATSVGMTAIGRFLRPVAYQNAPAALLPPRWPTTTRLECGAGWTAWCSRAGGAVRPRLPRARAPGSGRRPSRPP